MWNYLTGLVGAVPEKAHAGIPAGFLVNETHSVFFACDHRQADGVRSGRLSHRVAVDHQFAVDGDQKIVRTKSGESLTVVCCPYRADGRVDQWKPSSGKSIVLHHEPPANSQLAIPRTGNPELSLILEKLHPTWCVSGHVHFSPGERNQFFERIGSTICFNCRQNPPSDMLPPRPNTIVLDSSAGTAAWRRWFSTTSYDETIARLE